MSSNFGTRIGPNGPIDIEPVFVRDPSAQITVCDLDSDRHVVIECLQCIHCGRDFPVIKGRTYGMCMKCGARTCGEFGDFKCNVCTGPHPSVRRTGKG